MKRFQPILKSGIALQLRGELALVPGLAVWRAAEPENKYNLPSFSAYPQAYATAAGEYLMMLPQMLESLLASSGAQGDQPAGLDVDWLDKVPSTLLLPLSQAAPLATRLSSRVSGLNGA